ncbi:hypothetical protein FDENT_13112 [Fusarium denticulatum]|uniref:Uncharacterized protein n=1 Tax=Fusarium denticulatum TaxID=48507 RepID=A0A8H5T7B4_9HYPO|nr:hypothetical protein FDENT_13112 [Fusarium denticulatum]
MIFSVRLVENIAEVESHDLGCEKYRAGESGQKDPVGLTSSEYLVLNFWSNYLGTAEVIFLTELAHTICEERGRTGPYPRDDLDYG